MTKSEATAKAISRYVKGGGNEQRGREILAEELRQFAPQHLPISLVYWGFATVRGADALAAALCSDEPTQI